MHKITTEIARELNKLENGAILEDLKNIKHKILNKSREFNRKFSK